MASLGLAGDSAIEGAGAVVAGVATLSAALLADSGGALNCGISSFVRIAIITASVDSITAAAAANGQRRRMGRGASALIGRAPTSRAAAANIDARTDADGRSSSSALACR